LLLRWKVLLLLVLLAGYTVLVRCTDARRAALGLVLLFLALSPGVSPQYLAWPGPLALVSGESDWFRRWTLWSLPYVITLYFGVLYTPIVPVPWRLVMGLSMVGWLSTMAWLLHLYRTRDRAERQPAEARAIPSDGNF
jgi:hypothetical protein